ncbi:MAG: 50S ribosomal protein L4 [Actinobacteria bacterium]|nr:50S ribosomal protein L4 [Actinomycetota bacterium]
MSLTIDINDAQGKKVGSFDLPAEIFDVQVNIPLIHQVVTAQLAAARQGTHKAKNRGEVSGGGKKPFKQKGTGRARQGSTRSPNQRHGGVAQGPVPRLYDQRTPKKMIAAALRGVLSDRKKVLVVVARSENDVWRSLRSVEDVHLIVADQLNAYDVVNSDDVVFSHDAIKDFIAGPAKGKAVTAVARESEVGVSA